MPAMKSGHCGNKPLGGPVLGFAVRLYVPPTTLNEDP